MTAQRVDGGDDAHHGRCDRGREGWNALVGGATLESGARLAKVQKTMASGRNELVGVAAGLNPLTSWCERR